MRSFIPLTILCVVLLVGDHLFTSAAKFGEQHEDTVEDSVEGVAEMEPENKINEYEHPNKRSRVKHEQAAAVEETVPQATPVQEAVAPEDEEDIVEAGDEQEMAAAQEEMEQIEAEIAEDEAELEEETEIILKQGHHGIQAVSFFHVSVFDRFLEQDISHFLFSSTGRGRRGDDTTLLYG
jgi:hypothetical protein